MPVDFFLCKPPPSHPRAGSLSGPRLGKLYPSFLTSNLKGAPANATGHFLKSGFGVRVQAGTHCISRNRDTPQVWYQVLKPIGGLALFQSRFRLVRHSTKQSLLPVLFVRLFLKNLHLLHTGLESRNWQWSGESCRAGGRNGWDGGRVSDVPWNSWRSTSTESLPTSPPLRPALIYLSSVGNQTLALLKSHGLKSNWS